MQRVYAISIKSYKTYTCRECREEVEQGAFHILLRYLRQNRQGYDHHHLHRTCFERHIKPQLTALETIHISQAPKPRKKR